MVKLSHIDKQLSRFCSAIAFTVDSLFQVLSICCFSQVVEWLLGVVNHLPSEDQCQKCLVAPVDDKEKHDDMMLGRTKCYDLVTKVGLNQYQEERALI